jgi:mannose-6-phosphate isomerase
LYALSFQPFLRPMPWGGRRLLDWIDAQTTPPEPIGEAWLLSDHPIHTSQVANGPLRGSTLGELMAAASQDIVGRSAVRFPLLIKLLDARERLSVQVHPDDQAARLWAPTEGGKTEAWVVLESEPEAQIYLGLRPGVTRDDVRQCIANGTLPECLNCFRPSPGQCYYVPAGAVHALGAGVVVLEVQQTSDATFRLYDWERRDASGRPRALHLDAGLAVLQERFESIGPQRPHQTRLGEGGVRTDLVRCQFFSIAQFQISDSCSLPAPGILIGLEGSATVTHPSGHVPLRKASTILVPACLGEVRVVTRQLCRFVLVNWPD